MTTVMLSLISHTNVGKTTLARTLLRQDIGEVYDSAHVTDSSDAFTLVETDDARLQLWDTPGFGDSRRLFERLKREGDPVEWLRHQVWDRLLHRARYCSQAAVRNARDEADVILYLVNAAEAPEDAGYVESELEILRWIGKPVLFVLNQTGDEAPAALAAWQSAAERWPFVREVLSLDAFTRCWVQEDRLLERVSLHVAEPKRAAMEALAARWKLRNREVFDRSVRALSDYLGAACAASEPLEGKGKSPVEKAFERLRGRLDRATEDLMALLVEAHGLEGRDATSVTSTLANVLGAEGAKAPNKKIWAILGAAASGAASGVVTDLLAGGLTFGGGAVVGAVVGALGATGAAAVYERFTRSDSEALSWSPLFLTVLTREALLRYLAVAHHGRGRGDFRETGESGRWLGDLDRVLEDREKLLEGVLERTDERDRSQLEQALAETLLEVLERRYGA